MIIEISADCKHCLAYPCMSKDPYFEKSTGCLPLHCKNGQTTEASSVCELQADSACTTSLPSRLSSKQSQNKRQRSDAQSSTRESHLNTNGATCNDRSMISSEHSPTTQSFKTLAADLTSLDPGSNPFWSEFAKDTSAKLLSYTGTDYAALDSSSWSGSLARLARGSWFTVKIQQPRAPQNSPKISSPLLPSLSRSITDSAARKIAESEQLKAKKVPRKQPSGRSPSKKPRPNPEHEAKLEAKRQQAAASREKMLAELAATGVGRGGKKVQQQKPKQSKPTRHKLATNIDMSCDRLRIFPNNRQRKTLREWFGCTRWTYNKAVAAYKRLGPVSCNTTFLRRTIVNQGLHQGKATEWVLSTPTEVREGAIADFQKAVNANKAKAKKSATPLAFEMKFKSAKAESDSILISKKKCAKEVELLSKMMGERGKPVDLKWQHDMRLQKTRDGRFYICIPKPTVKVSDSQAPPSMWANDGVVALDPGVRTFVTGFDALGNVFEWGADDVQQLCRLQYHLDKLCKKIRQSRRHRSRYNMRKAASRLQNRIHQLVDELHRKLCKWLCESYRVIFLPKFEIRRMVKTGQRKLSRRTVRSLYVLRHYTFQQRLLSKAREYPWVKVFLVNEAHTSKTCTHCGWSHPSLGGKKVFECMQCQRSTPRDIGGARNILLRQLSVLNTQLP